jgi:small subunit ribosomal protein S18
MARGSNRQNDKPRRPRPERERRGAKRKVCIFCQEKSLWVDYKDVGVLRRFVSDRGKIRARRVSGCCSQHQREMAVAVKTARELALLPYTQRTLSERGGGPGGGRGRGRDGEDGDRGDRGDRGGSRGPRREAEVDPLDAELAAVPTSFDEGDTPAIPEGPAAEDVFDGGTTVGADEGDE